LEVGGCGLLTDGIQAAAWRGGGESLEPSGMIAGVPTGLKSGTSEIQGGKYTT